MLALTRAGMSRETAYKRVQTNSMKAWENNLDFKELIQSDPEIQKQLSPQEIDKCFSLDPYIDKIDYIFNRVLSDED
jgi:adenylosuccinate lyase